MRRSFTHNLISLVLTITTLVTLILNVPVVQADGQLWTISILYLLLTAIALPLSIQLEQVEFSAVHTVGIIAFLSLSYQDFPHMLWAMFLGSVIGSIILHIQHYQQLRKRKTFLRTLENIGISSARVTLSFYVAAQFYVLINGQLPLVAGSNDSIPPLALYCALYVTLYTAIYLLEIYIDGQNVIQVIKTSWLQMGIIFILPVAYSVLGAIVYTQLPIELFGFVIVGLVLIIIIPFGYSRNQDRLRQQLNELQMFSSLSNALQADIDTQKLLRSTYENLQQIIDFEYLLIAIINRETGKTLYQLADETQTIDTNPDLADVVLIKQLINAQDILLIENDVAKHLQSLQITPHKNAISSWLGTPLISNGQAIGAMVLYSTDQRIFQISDLRILQIVASTVATAIDNASLYEQQQQRLLRLNNLNTISGLLTSTLSLENVLDTITTSASMLTDAKAISVYWERSDSGDLNIVKSAGLSKQFSENPPDLLLDNQTIPTKTMETTTFHEVQPIIVEDIYEDERVTEIRNLLEHEKIRCFLEIPLVSDNESRGAIVAYYENPQRFNKEFIEFLRTFANESLQAIKNAQLYTSVDKALESRLAQLSILAFVGQQTNASVSLETISQIILQSAIDYAKVPHGLIVLQQNQPQSLRLTASIGYSDDLLTSQSAFNKRYFQKALTNEKYIFYNDEHPGSNWIKLAQSSTSQFIVPITRENERLGLLLLESDESNVFTEDVTRFILQLVNQAAIAIDSRNLFQTVTQARDRMQVILDAMSEAIILLNKDGQIVQANPATSLIGLDHQWLIHQNAEQIMDMSIENIDLIQQMGFKSKSDFAGLFDKLQTGASTWIPSPTTQYTVQGTHGILYIERQIVPVYGSNGLVVGLMFVFYDQTEKQELDRTREDFTRMIVHDLRSPMTAIVTSLSILKQIVPKDFEAYPKIEQITDASKQAIRKMMQRVDSLLDIAKMESGEINLELDRFILSDTIHNVITDLSPIASERFVELNNEVSNVSVHADADKIERVIQNLVDNSLKYTPTGTHVIIRSQPAGDEFVRIDIIDQGPGIPDDYKQRLFDRFVQIRGQRGARRGVGLGLTFCRLVVEAHGGKIWVEDNPEGGSVFAFTLPLATLTTDKIHLKSTDNAL